MKQERWVSFLDAGSPGFGRLDDDRIQVCNGQMFGANAATGQQLLLSEVELQAPCVPRTLFALWNNFKAAAQKNAWSTPTEPLYFLKAANSFNAPGAQVPKPTSYSGRILYEGELGVVIGRDGRNIALAEAEQYIFGYTCVNDVTALDQLRADSSFEQWIRAKSFDGFTPIGPCIATGLDASRLIVRTRINGRERQNYPVADMFFSPNQLVSLLSRDVTLRAGDIISCGTSLGAGPFTAGALVEVEIDGIGVLSNRMGEAVVRDDAMVMYQAADISPAATWTSKERGL